MTEIQTALNDFKWGVIRWSVGAIFLSQLLPALLNNFGL